MSAVVARPWLLLEGRGDGYLAPCRLENGVTAWKTLVLVVKDRKSAGAA